jgi:hypothetical protein
LRLLLPAESALRRLIVIAARDLVAKPPAHRPVPQGLNRLRKARDRISFRLFDPRKRSAFRRPVRVGPRLEPRIHSISYIGDPCVPLFRQDRSARPGPWRIPKCQPDGLAGALGLYRRLQALRSALADISGQARRLARLQARRRQLNSARPANPMRPGRPPGFRRSAAYVVDRILAECHGLATSLGVADTS